MSKRRSRNQLALFDEGAAHAGAPRVRPWRALLADSWSRTGPTASALEEGTRDLLRRNLAFLRAMDIHVDEAEALTRRFRELHGALVRQVAVWRAAGAGDAEAARPVLEAVGQLSGLRHEILTGLDAERSTRVMAAESRVRVDDFEVERDVRLAEFRLAEERGDVVTIEIPTRDP